MNARLYHLLLLLWALVTMASLVSADYDMDDLPREGSDSDSDSAYADDFAAEDYYDGEPTEESTADYDTKNPLEEEMADDAEEEQDYF